MNGTKHWAGGNAFLYLFSIALSIHRIDRFVVQICTVCIIDESHKAGRL